MNMNMNKYNITQVSNSLGVSQAIIAGWEKSGKLVPIRDGKEVYYTTLGYFQTI